MRQNKLVLLMALLGWIVIGWATASLPQAHADYFQYPCNYPFVGQGGDVNVIVDAGGQFCDGPTEVNWSHYHCEGGGATANLGALAIVGSGPLSLGGFGGSGIGGRYEDCAYRCPDGTVAPFPNPPAAWVKHMVLNPKDNDCDQHMGIRGPTSTPLLNALPGNVEPGEGAPPGVPVPFTPGGLPEGQLNPPAPVGPAPPTPPTADKPGASLGVRGSAENLAEPGVPLPSGRPVMPSNNDQSPLTPGSPMQMP